MNKIKIIITAVVLAIIIGLGITVSILNNKLEKAETEWKTAVLNNKAFEAENSALKDKTLQFQYTIDQLNYSNDSLVQKLNKARKDLKIKDKNIIELQYLSTLNHKVDSIIIHDTLFRNEVFLDTLIKDNWAKLQLQLSYPNKIVADYSFVNKTEIITSIKRETVDPPKKCWLCRLFQKKQNVLEVDVIQENPYCEQKEQKHIKIIK